MGIGLCVKRWQKQYLSISPPSEMRRWWGLILNKGGRPARNLLAILFPGLKSGATDISSLRDEEKYTIING